eukprot:6051235-Lingulodinium_polyedra.AAC.1
MGGDSEVPPELCALEPLTGATVHQGAVNARWGPRRRVAGRALVPQDVSPAGHGQHPLDSTLVQPDVKIPHDQRGDVAQATQPCDSRDHQAEVGIRRPPPFALA